MVERGIYWLDRGKAEAAVRLLNFHAAVALPG